MSKPLKEFKLSDDPNARENAHAYLETVLKKYPNAECREDNNAGIYSVWNGATEPNPNIVTDPKPLIIEQQAIIESLQQENAELRAEVERLRPIAILLEQAKEVKE